MNFIWFYAPHTDSDEVVMKSTSGYVRRPLSALWSWIKSKMDDEIITITKTLTLTTEWQDTGIMGADLPSGTYVVSCAPQKVVCSIYRDIYCGVMQQFDGITNSTNSNEISLHCAGHATNNQAIYLRTQRSDVIDKKYLRLQIKASMNAVTGGDSTATVDFIFKFHKLI